MNKRNEEIKRILQEEKRIRSNHDHYKTPNENKLKKRSVGIILGIVLILISLSYIFIKKTDPGTIAAILIFLLVGIFVFRNIYFKRLNEEIGADMYEKYQQALFKLSQNPKDTLLRQQALAIGRMYYSSSRPNHLLTVYDETAIANDIHAASGE
ncbi:hypothetical protein HQN89_02245 [Paenibacillus frigoriresistens]|uniref:hypothetical protein n=1 Tax=Paenibacillus alginolyticus TaxID=59839 RepID=UPI0015658674|nr:hypothetical protein [Paenibacillus frigoriresistens]NRF89860.1 hypothetical protein [Paenibacillus frigoriresistens]